MTDLTPRQRQILEFIQDAIVANGMPPTRAEIAQALGFRSANAAEKHLRALQRKGVHALMAGSARGIVLKDALREQFGLPLIGRVAAGRPILPRSTSRAASRSTRRCSNALRYQCCRGWLDSAQPRCIGFGGQAVDQAVAGELLRVGNR